MDIIPEAAPGGSAGQSEETDRLRYKLDESHHLIGQMMHLSQMAIFKVDAAGARFVRFNEFMCRVTGYTETQLAGMQPGDILIPGSHALFQRRLRDLQAGRPVPNLLDLHVRTKNGTTEYGRFHIRPLFGETGAAGANVVAHFITEQLRTRKELAIYRRKMGKLVQSRTDALQLANERLETEVRKRIQVAQELSCQSEHLKELNTALGVLLDKQNEDRLRTEENNRLKLRELIEPYVIRLLNSGLNPSQKQLLELIRTNLDEIVQGPISTRLAQDYIFSPNELQVASLIRQGRTTKEIANLLGISGRTVESYRHSIRRKLNLQNKKINLKTYLSSR